MDTPATRGEVRELVWAARRLPAGTLANALRLLVLRRRFPAPPGPATPVLPLAEATRAARSTDRHWRTVAALLADPAPLKHAEVCEHCDGLFYRPMRTAGQPRTTCNARCARALRNQRCAARNRRTRARRAPAREVVYETTWGGKKHANLGGYLVGPHLRHDADAEDFAVTAFEPLPTDG